MFDSFVFFVWWCVCVRPGKKVFVKIFYGALIRWFTIRLNGTVWCLFNRLNYVTLWELISVSELSLRTSFRHLFLVRARPLSNLSTITSPNNTSSAPLISHVIACRTGSYDGSSDLPWYEDANTVGVQSKRLLWEEYKLPILGGKIIVLVTNRCRLQSADGADWSVMFIQA